MARDLFAEAGLARDLFAEIGLTSTLLERRADYREDDGFLDRAGALAERGVARVGGGLQRFASTVAESLGAEEAAENYRDAARENETIAATPVAGETTAETVKADPSVGNVLRFARDQVIGSVTDMVFAGTGVGLAPYIASQAGRIGQERAENDGDADATLVDVVKAAPAAVGSALLERIGTRGLIAPGPTNFAVGVAKAAGKEAATEAGQEAIEYGGATIGTNAGFDPEQAAEQAAFGALAGGPSGAAINLAVDGTRRGVERIAPGIIETANLESDPTPEDEESPLPTDLVAQGKAMMAGAEAKTVADRLLAENGAPPTGSRVVVTVAGQRKAGVIEDAFLTSDPELGEASGIRIRFDDGTLFDEYFSTLADTGATLEVADEPAADAIVQELPLTTPDPVPAIAGSPALPVDGPISSPFGRRDAPKAGASTDHGGIDIAVPVGTLVRAPADGVVVNVGDGGKRGNWVEIDHGDGVISRYFHLDGFDVRPGDRVGAGDVFARSGQTGNVTGAHLHWSVLKDGQAVDPMGVEWAAAAAPSETAVDIDAPATTLAEVEALVAPEERPDIAEPIAAPPEAERPSLAELLAREERTAPLPLDPSTTAPATPASLKGGDPTAETEGDGSRTAPVLVKRDGDAAVAAAQAEEPSEAQREAGNFRMGHMKLDGLDISIEIPKGGVRRGTRPDGTTWETEMPAAYGYVKRTTGADGENVDVYVGDAPTSGQVFVIDQVDPETRSFDEHKVVLGTRSEQEAVEKIYSRAFSDGTGRSRVGGVRAMTMPEFKEWLKTEPDRPIAEAAAPQPEATAPEPQGETPTSSIVPIAAAEPGDVVDVDGITLARKGFKTAKEAELWAKANRLPAGGVYVDGQGGFAVVNRSTLEEPAAATTEASPAIAGTPLREPDAVFAEGESRNPVDFTETGVTPERAEGDPFDFPGNKRDLSRDERIDLAARNVYAREQDRIAQSNREAAMGKAVGRAAAAMKAAATEGRSSIAIPVAPQRQAVTLDEARGFARSFVGRPLRNDETGLVATVSGRTLGKMTSASAVLKSTSPAEHALAVANADHLFTKARPIEAVKDKKGEPTIAAVHRYVATMDAGEGRSVSVKMTVKETTSARSPNPLYTIETVEVEPGLEASPEGGIEPEPGRDRNSAQAEPARDIAEDLAEFNDEAGQKLAAQLDRAIPGRKVGLQVVDKLLGDKKFAGRYAEGVITVALEADQSPAVTLDHEVVHALRDLDLFRGGEWRALARRARGDAQLMNSVRERYPDLDGDSQVEEAVADLYAAWMAGERQERGFVASALRRMREFFGALGAALRGNGFTSAEAVMRAIDVGEVGGRSPTSAADGDKLSIVRRSAQEPTPRPAGSSDGGGRDGGGTTQSAAAPRFNDPSTESRWQDAKKGLGDGPGWVEQAKGWWEDVAEGFTRHWRDLPNVARFADLSQQLRKLEATPRAATERTVRLLRDLVGSMAREELDLFTRKVVLDDLQWEADAERGLPFGFTPETLAVEKAKIDRLIDDSDKLTAAVRKRKLVNRRIADEMVEAGVLTREQIRNPSYFRHMVLEYARAEMRLARGAGSKIKSPYWAKRMGSALDINANLLEAEFEWLQKAQIDIATAKTIEWIKQSDHNIVDRLKKKAKRLNDQALAAKIDKAVADAGEDAELAVQQREFRKTIAIGMRKVAKALQEDAVGDVPPHLRAAADKLTSSAAGDESVFPLLSWMLDNDKPGAIGAAMVLKAAGQRKTWTRQVLDRDYIDPADTPALVNRLAPDGYEAWQPREGRHLFTAKTVSEHVLDGFVDRLSDAAIPGISREEMALALSSVRNQLVVGGERYTMVLPKELADTLNEFGDRRVEGMFSQISASLLGNWKRWVLINPRRFFKYNLNNTTGDLDAVLAGNPGTLSKVWRAGEELYAVMKRGEKPSERYQEAVERGVFDSGLSVQEIPEINRLSAFRHLTEEKSLRPDKLTVLMAGKVWRALQGATQWRENVFRYAAYLDYVEKVEAGRPTGYGASIPGIVDAVKDPKDRAALLARDLIGDYGAISVAGGWLRRYLIPFWSWTEINTRRYWRLTSNAWSQGVGKGIATGGLLAISTGARLSATLYIRMALLYGLMNLWNQLFFPDEEDDLGEFQKRQLHLILGRDSNGEVVTLRTQGALSDVIGMLGLPDAKASMERYLNDQGSLGRTIGDMTKAWVNRIATSLRPEVTVSAETMLDQKFWPDIFNPRPIHDNWRHVFSTFSLENEYDWIAGKPSRGYDRSWTESIVYRRDPGEMAYDGAKGLAYDWLERVKGQRGSGGFSSPRGDALRDYRKAVRYGDEDAATKALEEYYSFEGTDEGFEASIRRQHPLGPIAKRDREAFLDSLTDEQYETLLEAERWYDEVYLGADEQQ